MEEHENPLNKQDRTQSKLFKIPYRYRDKDGGINENQLHDDLDQYQIDNIQAVINEILRRLQEVNPNNENDLK